MDNNVEKVDLDRVDWKSSCEFFESLGEALDKLDDKDESYNFTWVGKRKSIVEAGAPINKILRPDMEASKDFDNTKNMLIVGDNLDALKLLQESYLGKIKMIYIDPPYNTGHDFVYRDNFTIKKADFNDSTTDVDGNIIISEDEYAENSKVNGRFHSDWLSMMYPRLKLAKNLLSDDGVLFVSISDEEHSNLRKLLDEVFGEENLVANLVWTNNEGGGSSDSKYFKVKHEYVLCYARNIESLVAIKNLGVEDQERYRLSDEYIEERGRYQLVKLSSASLQYSNSLDYELASPDGTIIKPVDNTDKDMAIWRWSKQKYDWGVENGFVEWKKDKNGIWQVYTKQYLNCDKDGNIVARTKKPLGFIDKYSSTQGSKELFNLLEEKTFSFPKPTALLDYLIERFSYCDDDIILDFFAGSGTTGHAVMRLNALDNKKRHYILAQIDELIDDKSEAKKAGYNTIDQITAERLRRAGEKIKSEHPEAHIDTGFRVFRVDGSNENEGIRKPLNQINQSDLFGAIDNVKKDRTPLDLLFGVIYASALPFDFKLEARKIGENTVYLYGYLDEGTGLVACFDDNLSEETLKEIAKLKALTAAFKDSSFTDSAAKINLSEHFRIICPDTKVKVL